MVIGGMLIGVLTGAIVSLLSLYLGASMMSAFLLYSGIGGAALLVAMMAVALRAEDQDYHATINSGIKAASLH